MAEILEIIADMFEICALLGALVLILKMMMK